MLRRLGRRRHEQRGGGTHLQVKLGEGRGEWLTTSFLDDSEVGEEAGLRPCPTEGSLGSLEELAVRERPNVGLVTS